MTDAAVPPSVSRRLVRAYVRYLEGRIGPSLAAFVETLPADTRALVETAGHKKGDGDWDAIEPWRVLLTAVETQFGDHPTWRLVREATRATMAEAVSRAWSAFLADITPDTLLARADTFWRLSYNVGQLVVAERKPRSVRIAVEGWRPAAPVGVILAEACAVFLARLGERAPRAILSGDDASASGSDPVTVELSW